MFGGRWLLACLLGVVATAVGPSRLDAQDLSLTLVRPAAGFLASDGVSKIPLEILAVGRDGPLALERASVTTRIGKIGKVVVAGPGRISFTYSPPKRSQSTNVTLEIELRRTGGDQTVASLGFELPRPRAPSLKLSYEPTEFPAGKPSPIELSAVAAGPGLQSVSIHSSVGKLAGPDPVRGPSSQRMVRTLELPASLPQDAPSHVLLLAAAATDRGFSARPAGVSILAPVRISAEIPGGAQLTLKGTENKVAPVVAPPDGKTVIDGIARYGSEIRAFYQLDGKQTEIPIVVPSGLVAVGLVAPVPDQDIADGGTGPSILVSIPPPAFGGSVIWPEIQVEGAKLIKTQPLDKWTQALILERPTEPSQVAVVLDGIPAGSIYFRASHGRSVELSEGVATADERGAAKLIVRDSLGHPSDHPTPRVRLESGTPLILERVGEGEYRVIIPATTDGAAGTEVSIVAELPPPVILAGDAPELVQETLSLKLEGTQPALRAAPPPEPSSDVEAPGPSFPLLFSLAMSARAGTTLGKMVLVGGGVGFETRLPLWDQRVLARVGLELYRGSASGEVVFGEGRVKDASTELGGVVLPVEVGAVLLPGEDFELNLRAGLGIRFESAGFDVDDTRAGGNSRVSPELRASLEAVLGLGPGGLTAGLTLDGLGASGSGFSNGGVSVEGSLAELRLDLGYRLWL